MIYALLTAVAAGHSSAAARTAVDHILAGWIAGSDRNRNLVAAGPVGRIVVADCIGQTS